MLIGLNFFQGDCFQTTVALPSFYKTELSNSVVDEIYIDEDTEITDSIAKPTVWGYKTVLDAPFSDDSLEGGSITSNGLVIDHILFQKRKADELYWSDVSQITYDGTSTFYEAIDKYVACDFDYEYSLLPMVNEVQGNRVISPTVTVLFDGVFLSDKDNNYSLIFDVVYGSHEHITQSTELMPLNAQYPTIVFGNSDYVKFDIKSTSVSDTTYNSGGKIDIKQEKLTRNKLFNFLKNKKPKIYRDGNGNIFLVSLLGNPTEEHQNGINGISKVSFALAEIGNYEDTDILINAGLLEGLTTI